VLQQSRRARDIHQPMAYLTGESNMKAFKLVIFLAGAIRVFGTTDLTFAQEPTDKAGNAGGARCGSFAMTAPNKVRAAEHDSIYEPLNGITNDAPVNKAERMGWKSAGADGSGAVKVSTEAASHDSVYDGQNGLTNDAPVNKAERQGWRQCAS
jgi:hypothetical protein